MSRVVEFSDEVYEGLKRRAEARGMSLDEWFAAQAESEPRFEELVREKQPESMADLLEDWVGVIDSGGEDQVTRDTGEAFTDYLIEKKKAGRL